jgi:hypothetical protein
MTLTNIVLGQSRQNAKSLTEVKNTKFLRRIIGWQLNSTNGEWAENKNMIYHKHSQYRLSFVDENMDSMTFSKVIYKDTPYFVLLIHKETGYYEYPSIKKDWKTVKGIKYLIFEESEYQKIKMVLNQDSENVFLINIYSNGTLDNRFDPLSEKRVLLAIEKDLNFMEAEIFEYKEKWDKNKSDRKKYSNNFMKYFYETNYKVYEKYFPIISQTVDEKKVVRFLFITSDYGIEDILKNKYFEIDTSNFSVMFVD